MASVESSGKLDAEAEIFDNQKLNPSLTSIWVSHLKFRHIG